VFVNRSFLDGGQNAAVRMPVWPHRSPDEGVALVDRACRLRMVAARQAERALSAADPDALNANSRSGHLAVFADGRRTGRRLETARASTAYQLAGR
jgi:hypothetical protein